MWTGRWHEYEVVVAAVSKRLVIAEKPSVAADIARVLAGTGVRFTRREIGWESANWVIAAARGHLVAEADPEQYDATFKQWRLEDLPIVPPRVLYRPRDASAAGLLRGLKVLINRDDITEIVNACDAGREGELIFKLIVQYSGSGKPISRAWFSSMTPTAIVAALGSLRPDAVMKPLEAAARCRAEADWLVGINATRAATVRLGRGDLLSLGRVQTPTLALVVRRDLEIAGFTSRDYFQLRAALAHPAAGAAGAAGGAPVTAGQVVAWHVSAGGGGRGKTTLTDWDTRAQVDAVAAVLTGQAGRVVSCETSVETSAPPRLFDLTGLQQAANRVYGFSAARTLAAAQACYETHKILTYPRTDSCYLTSDMAGGIPAVVTATATADPGLAGAAAAIAGRAGAGQDPVARLVNDAKVTDHHAIIPTLNSDLSGVDQDARRIYDLVARRFLAALLPAATFIRRTLLAAVTGSDSSAHLLRATSRTRTSAGWQDVFPGPGIAKQPTAAALATQRSAGLRSTGPAPTDGEPAQADHGEQEELLPDLPVGTPVRVVSCEPIAKKTSPPAAFTDASLLGAMATAGKLVTDDDLAEAMKQTGLGTPATRAATIERLIKVGYLERQGRAIRATGKGTGVITVLGDHPLVHPDLTGSWEARLRAMETTVPGTETTLREAFLTDVRAFTGQVTRGIIGMDQTGFTTRPVLGPCPILGCGGQVVERGKSWSCDSWVSKEQPGCGYVIWKQAAGRRVTKTQAKKLLASAAPTLPNRTVAAVLAPCPLPNCSGSIIARTTSYSCDSWRSASDPGCGYVLWKTSKDGTDLSEQAARDLIARGVSHAKPAPEVICPCPAPRCKGSIVETDRAFSCNSWRPDRKGCGTVVWKADRAGNVVTREDLSHKLAQAVPAPKSPSRSRRRQRPH